MGKSSLLIPRSEWKAAPPRYPVTMVERKDLFIVHHSGSGGAMTWSNPGEEAATLRAWQAYHQGPKMGGADLYYGAVIFPSGRAYEGREGGWLVNNGGAYGCNSRGFGACLAGNYNREYPTLEALETLVKLALEAHEVLGIPVERYWGHRDCARYDARNQGNDCPGDTLYNWLPTLRGVVARQQDEQEEEPMKFYAQRTELRAPNGWYIYNVPSCNGDWWIDISNEYDAPVAIKVFANAQDKTMQSGGYGEYTVPNTRAEKPGIHARLKDLAKGLNAEWSEVSIHAERPLSILVGN